MVVYVYDVFIRAVDKLKEREQGLVCFRSLRKEHVHELLGTISE